MTEPAVEVQAGRPSSRGRALSAALCLILAALLTTPAVVAFWGQRTINDGQRYVETVGPLVDSPEVQAAIAAKVTDALEAQVDVESLLNEAFSGVITQRPRLQALVGPLSGAVNGLIESQVRAVISSDAFREAWLAANARAQVALLRVLRGDNSGALSVQDDQVVLDVSDVIDEVKQRLVDRGLTMLDNVPVPDQGRQIVLLNAPQLDQVRTIYAFSNPVAKWLLVVVALLFLSAFVLARRRPRMSVAIGIALALNAALLAITLSVGRQLFVNELSGTVFGPASSVFYDQLLSYLERGHQVLFRLGVVLVVLGWFTGTSRSGVATRSLVASGLESVGAAISQGQIGQAGQWVMANARWLRVVSALLGVVVLLWGNDISQSRLYWSVLLVLVLLVAVQVLVGAGQGRSRSAAPPPEAIPG
ncbi:hypothetical protein [Nocardioides sp.]|uniref:hypothetical protein n=1 Tax=Nocardioides sp. TaxID=35761 RepID=UPI003D0DBDB9